MAEQGEARIEGCAAIILAAGASSRLGRAKQLLLFQGEPLVRRTAILALTAGACPVLAIVGGPQVEMLEAALAGLAVTLIHNVEPGEGMASSLRLGVAALQNLHAVPERVLLLVCDQPLLRVEDVRALMHFRGREGIAAAQYNNRVGVPAVFDRRHFPALARVTGDQGARELLRSRPVAAVAMPTAALDIDMPEDLEKLDAYELLHPE